MPRARIKIPETVRRGERFEIRTVVLHRMESGFRKRAEGGTHPRGLIRSFRCEYRGQEIFAADFGPAVSANPYLAFHAVAEESGPLVFIWTGDNGFGVVETAELKVV